MGARTEHTNFQLLFTEFDVYFSHMPRIAWQLLTERTANTILIDEIQHWIGENWKKNTLNARCKVSHDLKQTKSTRKISKRMKNLYIVYIKTVICGCVYGTEHIKSKRYQITTRKDTHRRKWIYQRSLRVCVCCILVWAFRLLTHRTVWSEYTNIYVLVVHTNDFWLFMF